MSNDNRNDGLFGKSPVETCLPTIHIIRAPIVIDLLPQTVQDDLRRHFDEDDLAAAAPIAKPLSD